MPLISEKLATLNATLVHVELATQNVPVVHRDAHDVELEPRARAALAPLVRATLATKNAPSARQEGKRARHRRRRARAAPAPQKRGGACLRDAHAAVELELRARAALERDALDSRG
jgi:hypothetical protein